MPQPIIKNFRVRQALFSDFNKLLEFYEAEHSPELPLEPAKVVGDTIAAGRILIVESTSEPGIPASGAVFQQTPQASLTYVGELAGMRVTNVVGGAGPISVQMMLIGLRLLGHVAYEPKVSAKGATNSLVTIIKHDNTRSIENIEAMGLKPLVARPAWMKFNEIGWHGKIVESEWKYYYADNVSIVRSLQLLSNVGLFEGVIVLTRTNKKTGNEEEFRFALELNDLTFASKDLHMILDGKTVVDLVPPPAAVVFKDQ